MLNAMRRSVSSIFVMVLMGLLIASFAIWGIGDIFRQSAGSGVAEVGDKEISPQEYARDFQSEVRRLQRRLGGEFTAEQAISLGLGQQVLQNLVLRETFGQAAERLGLYAPDERVRDEIRSSDVFKNSLGEFDQQTYEMMLSSANMSPGQFEENARRDISRADLMQSLLASVTVPDMLAKTLYIYRNEQRVTRMLTVPASTIKDIAVPDEEMIRDYHQDNARLFMAPEYRQLSYVYISPDDVTTGAMLSDEELKALYNERAEDLGEPEKRMVQQIVLSSEEEARKWHDKITAGTSFEAVAKEAVDFTPEDTRLGNLTKRDLTADINATAAARVFALKQGEVSEPVESMFGWNIFKVAAITPGREMPFEEAKSRLAEEIRHQRAIDDVIAMADKFDTALAGGASLADASAEMNLTLHHVVSVDRGGNAPDGTPADLPTIDDFLTTAFAEEINSSPILYDTPEGGYYAVTVENIMPPVLRPLEDVRETVLQNLNANLRDEEAKRRAQEIADKVKSGADLESLKSLAGGELQENVKIGREDDSSRGLSPAVRDAVFSLEPDSAAYSAAANQDGYVVFKLTRVISGETDMNEEAVRETRQKVSGEFANDILVEYQNLLHREYGFSINREVMNQVNAQISGQTP